MDKIKRITVVSPTEENTYEVGKYGVSSIADLSFSGGNYKAIFDIYSVKNGKEYLKTQIVGLPAFIDYEEPK